MLRSPGQLLGETRGGCRLQWPGPGLWSELTCPQVMTMMMMMTMMTMMIMMTVTDNILTIFSPQFP